MTDAAVEPTMRAAVYRSPGELEVTDWPTPELGPHDVLLEVSHCGVCGSDLHIVIEGWGQPNTVEGHEYTGTVAAVGSDVTKWQVGDQVVAGASLRCGTCEMCRQGRPSLCLERGTPGMESYTGAYARYKANHEDTLHALPEGMSLRVAALAEPLAVALHAITQSRIELGQRAMVLGAGPIGSLIIAALRAKGIDEVTVVEPAENRRELGLAVGATTGRHPEDLQVFDQGDPGRVNDDPHDVVFECSGKRVAMEAGLCQLKRGGTLVLVGAGIERPRFDPNRILMNELLITGAFVYDPDGFERALELLGRPDFPVDRLIEPQDVSLGGLLAAMEGLAAGRIPAKVMVAPGLED